MLRVRECHLSQLQEASEGHYAVKAARCLLRLGWIVSAFLYLGCWIVSLCTHGLVGFAPFSAKVQVVPYS
jgi:hypothetical protein